MILFNILLAYQLENYKNSRFLKFIYTHPKFWIFGSKRQKIDMTSKAKLILVLATIFIVGDIAGSIFFLSGALLYISLIFIYVLLPIYFVIANILIAPLDRYLKHRIIKKAQQKISQYTDLKIIAITGSMGKTTTKEFLYTLLCEKFSVLATEGTKNTPLGISRVILKKLTKKHKIFIVEMGAYEKGNIAELCTITPPHISVITGITLQHLERFGGLEEIIDTKFEIIESLEESGLGVINISTTGAQRGLKEKKFTTKNIKTVQKGLPFTYRDNLEGISFELEGTPIETKILSNYIVESLQICWIIAQELGVDIQSFRSAVQKIEFIDHRMQLIKNEDSNIFVIDDSFNGNIEGVHSLIHLMKHAPFTGRKIIVAAGVVELGELLISVNSKLGRQIGEVADMVLLVEGPVGNALLSGLHESGYPQTQIKIYPSALSLHDDIKNITKSGDMIIFQNDLPDHYL